MDGLTSTPAQRWLARLSFLLAGLAIVVLLVLAGLKSLAMVAVGLAAAVVGLAAAYFFLSRRGIWRWLSLAVFVLAPIAVIVVYAFRNLLWIAVLSAAVWLLAGMTARLALAGSQTDWRMPEHPAQPPARHPYLIMNPKSGGGKVEKFDLQRKAEELGAEVFLIDGPEPVDVARVARVAVEAGADLLGVAGGDGTQALVAGIAAEHGIPFLVISAGTRNHFALDLGLDREDPSACLSALSDGVELRVDLGVINGQTFVNNASFGAYAEVVETPAYRGDKVNTTLNTLPDLLQGHRGARLRAQADGTGIEAPQALLVSNNPYGTGDIAGLGRRARLDRGTLGVVGITVANARQAAGLIRGKHATGLSVLTTKQIEISTDVPQIPVGVDGESILMPTPVTCTVSPARSASGYLVTARASPRRSRQRTGPGCGTSPAFRKLRLGHRIDRSSEMAKKKKKDERDRDDAETQASSSAAGEEARAEPPAKMKRKEYERQMRILHGELVAMQEWVKDSGAKICVVFEGRDTAGKGGTIKRITERVSPRVFRVVALPTPTEREKTQMYIQRYIQHFPAAGEVVIFDRSWYNRAGVERVMGFCQPEETERFLELAPAWEKAMADSGILLLKYWLEVSPGEQTRRLESRINDPRKIWKLSPMDLKSYSRWYDYSRARDAMFAATDTAWGPWYIADADDKKRARLNIISHLLSQVPYKPLAHRDIKLPRRQPSRGYVQPDLPLRHIPTPF